MAAPPLKCPKCGEKNSSSLNYCVVCGTVFHLSPHSPKVKMGKRRFDRDQKLRLKREKKRKELTELFKKKKITLEQYRKGLKKLGYLTDVDKAEDLKKYIREQIGELRRMNVAPRGSEGPYHYDPYASKSDLPRDEVGNVITDFMVAPGQKGTSVIDSYTMSPKKAVQKGKTGPVFGESLIGQSERKTSTSSSIRIQSHSAAARTKVKSVHSIMSATGENARGSFGGRRGRKVGRLARDIEWEEEEVGNVGVGSDEEGGDFEIDLSEEDNWWEDGEDEWWDKDEEGEEGWWDDDEWELEWEDEDDDQWEDWGITFEDDSEGVEDDEEEADRGAGDKGYGGERDEYYDEDDRTQHDMDDDYYGGGHKMSRADSDNDSDDFEVGKRRRKGLQKRKRLKEETREERGEKKMEIQKEIKVKGPQQRTKSIVKQRVFFEEGGGEEIIVGVKKRKKVKTDDEDDGFNFPRGRRRGRRR